MSDNMILRKYGEGKNVDAERMGRPSEMDEIPGSERVLRYFIKTKIESKNEKNF